MAELYAFETLSGQDLPGLFDEIASLYVVAYNEPQIPGTIGHADAFAERTLRQAANPGFVLVVIRDADGQLAGFSFGLPFAEDRWWGGVTDAPAEIVGQRKFAIIELVVREDARGRGLSRRLLQNLTAGRTEPYATLWADPTDKARDIYRHWGWAQVGQTIVTDSRPLLHVLVHSLPLFD